MIEHARALTLAYSRSSDPDFPYAAQAALDASGTRVIDEHMFESK